MFTQHEELDPRPFFQLLHAMLRNNGNDDETERTNRVMEWLSRTRKTVDAVCTRDEMRLVGLAWQGWTKHKQTPTRDTMTTLAEGTPQPKVLFDLLDGYDKCVEYLLTLTHADMDYYLEARIEDFERRALMRVLNQAMTIATGSIPNPASTKFAALPPLSGTRDALSYIVERFQHGILITDVRADGGQLSAYSDRLQIEYDTNKIAKANGKLFIPTGIPIVDRVMGGLRRKEMTGVLGFVGQRKTAVVRTMAYNAAKAGFRVLHIPLESDFKDELTAYNVMHAHAQGAFGLPDVTRMRFDSAEFTHEEYELFMNTVIKDFANTVGQNLLVYDPKASRAWEDIRAVIERENYIQPLDLVVVDYLTMLGDPTARDVAAAKIAMIQDVKQMTLNTGERGFAFVTPVQGNRKGYEDAQGNDGAWQTTGIATYSEMDKTLDNCLYVFTDDDISATGQIKIGSCKHRRGPNIPATFTPTPLNINAGMLAATEERDFAPAYGSKVVYTAEEYYGFMRPK